MRFFKAQIKEFVSLQNLYKKWFDFYLIFMVDVLWVFETFFAKKIDFSLSVKAGLTSVSDFSRTDFIFADQMASRSTAVQQVLNKTNRRVPLYSIFTVNNMIPYRKKVLADCLLPLYILHYCINFLFEEPFSALR